jgi:hypothetical protein
LSDYFHDIRFLFYFVNYTHAVNLKVKNQKSKLRPCSKSPIASQIIGIKQTAYTGHQNPSLTKQGTIAYTLYCLAGVEGSLLQGETLQGKRCQASPISRTFLRA